MSIINPFVLQEEQAKIFKNAQAESHDNVVKYHKGS